MAKQRALLAINPSSGRRRNDKACARVEAHLREAGYDVLVCLSKGRGDVYSSVRENGAAQDLLVCCGGDGTYHEMITAIVDGGIGTPVYHLPHGTANDMARTLDLPRGTEQRLALLDAGRRIPCDAGHIEGDGPFVYVAAFGEMAALSYLTPQAAKRRYGYLAYLMAGAKALRGLRGHEAVVDCDGRQYRGKYVAGCVCNTTSVARLIRLRRGQVGLGDGEMEVLLIRFPEHIGDLIAILWRFLTRRMGGKHILLERARRCTFRLAEAVPWTVDGEELGQRTEVTVDVRRHAFSVYCGPDAAEEIR